MISTKSIVISLPIISTLDELESFVNAARNAEEDFRGMGHLTFDHEFGLTYRLEITS